MQDETRMDYHDALFSLIAQAAKDDKLDVVKELLARQERSIERTAEVEFNAAMARLQPKLPTIKKGGSIVVRGQVMSTYARYEDIDRAIRPLYTEEGFSVSFNSETGPDGLVMHATLSHRLGHKREASLPLPLDTSGSKNSVQSVGSTVSYGKRYLVTMLFNIVCEGEDDDAQSVGTISQDQADTLETLIRDTGSDIKRFLYFMRVSELSQIRSADYAKALNALESKRVRR